MNRSVDYRKRWPGRLAGQHLGPDDRHGSPLDASTRGRSTASRRTRRSSARRSTRTTATTTSDREARRRGQGRLRRSTTTLTRRDIAAGPTSSPRCTPANPEDGWISLEVLPSLAPRHEGRSPRRRRLSRPPRPAERLHQGARDAGRLPRDPHAHRRGRLRERDAHVQPQALPRRRLRLPWRRRGFRADGRRPLEGLLPSRRFSSRASTRSSTSSSTEKARRRHPARTRRAAQP